MEVYSYADLSRPGLTEPDWERQDIDEGIDLKDTEKEHSEVFKRLCEEVPEETNVWSEVRHCQPVGKNLISLPHYQVGQKYNHM